MPRKPTDAQRIAELICKRKAFSEKKTLPTKFWNDPEFARNYRLQIIQANALLKKYSATAILNALNSKEGDRVWSLTARWLDPIIAKEQKRLDELALRQEQYILEQARISFENGETSPLNPLENSSVEGEIYGPKPLALPKQSLLEKLD